ncbi:hypothetical protein GCM10027059_05270 [Myceligenerans halotolerans]
MRNFSAFELRSLVIVPIVDYAPRETSGADFERTGMATWTDSAGAVAGALRRINGTLSRERVTRTWSR